MPTTHPRYTVTDTGDLRDMLDVAQRRWPEVNDRRQLLLLLTAAGLASIANDLNAEDRTQQRRRQREALSRADQLVDLDALLSDAAWR